MNLIGPVRLGRDVEVRYLPDGTPVASISGAYNYGRKDMDGKRPTQWVELSLWGERVEKLSEWLVKGQQIYVVCSDAHVETYERRDGGSGHKFVAKIDTIEFVGSRPEQSAPPAPRPTPASAPRAPAAPQRGGFDDMDDDIPF